MTCTQHAHDMYMTCTSKVQNNMVHNGEYTNVYTTCSYNSQVLHVVLQAQVLQVHQLLQVALVHLVLLFCQGLHCCLSLLGLQTPQYLPGYVEEDISEVIQHSLLCTARHPFVYSDQVYKASNGGGGGGGELPNCKSLYYIYYLGHRPWIANFPRCHTCYCGYVV